MRPRPGVVASCLLSVALVACSSSGAGPSGSSGDSPGLAVSPASASPTPAVPNAAETTPTQAPIAGPSGSGGPGPSSGSTGEVRLCFDTPTDHGSVAQVEIVTPAGRRIDIDVADPIALQVPPTADDVLLTTHTHPDHISAIWAMKEFAGQKLMAVPGSIDLADATITGIAAGHGDESGPASGPDGSDVIFVVEVGGLRIVHFGDLGQATLTADQLRAIGRVDVAISQFFNPYSSMDASNQMGFDQMKQVKPRLIVPTHLMEDTATARLLASSWPAAATSDPCIEIAASKLPASTSVLFMGYNAEDWTTPLKLGAPAW